MAVYLARDGRFFTLALDVDRGGALGAAQVSCLRSLLGAAGVGFVEAISGPAGHRHLLATWPEGLSASAVARVARALRDSVAPDLDVTPLMNPVTGCIRPPGAQHRHGGRSRVVGSPAHGLAVLRRGNNTEAFVRLAALAGVGDLSAPAAALGEAASELICTDGVTSRPSGPRRDLSAPMRALLRDGVVGCEDRSQVAARVTLAMVNARWSFAEFLACVHDSGYAGLAHLRDVKTAGGRVVPRAGVEAAARRMWDGRVRFAVRHPAVGRTPLCPATLEAVAAAAARGAWAGQGGPSARVVFERLLGLARQLGTERVAHDVRSVAVETGLSRSAAGRALLRLRESGWLRAEEGGGRGRLATTYLLQVPPDFEFAAGDGVGGTLVPAPPSPALPANQFELGLVARPHDAMTSSGLGRYAGLVLDMLSAAPASASELTSRSGLDVRTVRRHLGRLEALGLAACSAADVWAASPEALDVAAMALGVAGVVERRRADFIMERVVWAWWLADFHAERGYSTLRGVRRLGRAVMSSGVACPRQPFPLDACGRRAWAAGMSVARSGMGMMPEELARVDLSGVLSFADGRQHRARPRRELTNARRSRIGEQLVLPFAA